MNKIFAMIPARIGSVRLKKKNLALINKKPLIEYAIDAAMQSKIFNKILTYLIIALKSANCQLKK